LSRILSRVLGIFFLGILFFPLSLEVQTVRVGVYRNPPLVLQKEKGRFDGLFIRILKFVAQKEGWAIEYHFDTFGKLLTSLEQGEIDLLVAFAYSPERAQRFDFNRETVWLNWGVIYTHPSISIQSFLDLHGRQIYVVSNDVYYQVLQQIVAGFALDCRFVEVDDYEEVALRVREGKGVGVMSRSAGEYFGPRYGLKPSPLVFSPVPLHFATPKGKNTELLEALDRWLPALKEDPQSVYRQAIRELMEMETPWRLPRWVHILLLLIGGAAGVLILFTRLLQLQVKRKTQELQNKNRALEEEAHRRSEAERKLHRRLQLEEMLGEISARFLSGTSLEELVRFALSKVGTFLKSEYLLARLPGEEYFFGSVPATRSLPLLPGFLEDENLRETWEKERRLLLTVHEDESTDTSWKPHGTFFAFPLRLNEEGEGFGEGLLKEEYSEEYVSFIPIVIQYLGALLEYVWAVKRQREKDRWFRVTLESLGDGVITTDPEGRVTFLNPVAEKLTGWSSREAQGKPIEKVFPIVNEETGQAVENPVRRILQSGKVQGLANHTLLIRRDGQKVAIDDSGAPIIDEDGKTRGVVMVFRDITERRFLEEIARGSERMYRLLFNTMPDGFAVLEEIRNGDKIDYRILESNPSLEKLFYRFGPLEGKTVGDLFPNWRERFAVPPVPNPPDRPQRLEFFFPELEAFLEIVSFSLSPGKIGILVTDITLRRKAEEKICYFSFHDALTGLYNRLFAEEELRRLDDGRHLPLSIIFADLNGLKFLNDAFGHEKGDIMLRKAAQVLQDSCRESDIVARFGGDEFLIILPNTSFATAREIVERIHKLCQKVQEEEVLFLCLALGTATKTEPSQDIWELVNQAEERAYERKLTDRTLYQGEALLGLLRKALIHYGIERNEELQALETLAVSLGEKIGVPGDTLPKLRLLTHFHDVGKLTVPPEILHKKGALTTEEWTVLKTHPVAGYRIARTVPVLAPIAEEIHALRERWDGSGYPLGRKGEEIPLFSRVVQVAEAYLALLAPRPYREKPFTPDEAIQILRQEAGHRFDPAMVTALFEIIPQGRGFPSGHPQE